MTTTAQLTLAINAGSSTVKSALFTFEAEPRVVARGTIDAAGDTAAPQLIAWVDAKSGGSALAAVGHRIVHGGSTYRDPERLTPEVLRDLDALVPFAPNHLPGEIALARAFAARNPRVPHFACFDTAFHQTMPELARRLPIPVSYEARGIRRYGFHGLSYAYLSEELRRVAPREASGRVVLAHLGNGSSLAAVVDGRSIDTTMAFTPIGGVVMGTRSGDLDPGVVTYLGRTEGLSPDAIEDVLSKQSGLLGLSGATSDMRALLAREAHDVACRLAVDAYVYSVTKAIGALAAAMGGIDAVVFAGGIGEHAPAVRERICARLAFLGVTIDPQRNSDNQPLVSPPDGGVAVRVIPTDEERMIARAAHRLLAMD